jgi:hypothetical protein
MVLKQVYNNKGCEAGSCKYVFRIYLQRRNKIKRSVYIELQTTCLTPIYMPVTKDYSCVARHMQGTGIFIGSMVRHNFYR